MYTKFWDAAECLTQVKGVIGEAAGGLVKILLSSL